MAVPLLLPLAKPPPPCPVLIVEMLADDETPVRLEWSEIQSAHYLIGEIDYQATGNGTVVCRDGFRATTADRSNFEKLAASLDVTPRITEVDGSSLFCEFVVP